MKITLIILALTFVIVTSSFIKLEDHTSFTVLKNDRRINDINGYNDLVVTNRNHSVGHRRHKRELFTLIITAITAAVGISSTIANVVVGEKQRVLQREAAERAARHFRKQNELKMMQLCSAICVTEWESWSACTKPCGSGTTTRTRKLQSIGVCGNLTDFECPLKHHLDEKAICNYGCLNGGANSDDGCACRKGFKGQCCQEVSVCPYPGQPRHGSVAAPPSGFPGNYLELIQFKCNESYTLIGEDYAICQANGTWSRGLPKCELIQCYPEGSRQNIQLLNSKPAFAFGEALYYSCKVGYKLVGPKSRTCEINLDGTGRWSGFNPLCEAIRCDDPNSPVNGQRIGNDFQYGKQIRFTCSQGFTLIGSEMVTCSVAGQWTGNIPKCEQIVCEAPFVPRNGEVKVSSQHFGTTAIFDCLPGYRLNGPKAIFCEEGGAWNDTEPKCDAAICPDPGTPENGFKDGTIYFYPHNVTFGCFQGFELTGNEEISCMESGIWSGPVPQCRACGFGRYMESGSCKYCPEFSNTTTMASTSRHQCLCNNGYAGAPGGPCEEINCPKLGAPPFGQISQCDTKLGSRCLFTCDEGFILERGSSERVCRDKGDWDGTNALCAPCPYNTYQSGEVQCTPCPSNSHTEDVGQTIQGCVCYDGYQGPAGGPCTDVNECFPNEGKGPCEDTCKNSVGSYSCGCTIPGYVLDADGHSCKVEQQCTNLTEADAPANGGLVCHWFTRHNSQQCAAKCDPGFVFPARINNYELCGSTTGFQWSFRQEDPTAKFNPCIEEFFPGVRLEGESNYFVRRCNNLTEEEQKAVKEQFAEVLNSEGICKDRAKQPVCGIKDIAIICGRSTRRRKRRGVYEEESSVDFAFNVTALRIDISTEQCPDICKRLRIPARYCKRYCVPAYKRYLQAAILSAKSKLADAFDAINKTRMNFIAAQRHFEAEGAKASDVITECDPGMKNIDQQCMPCFPGTYYSIDTNECVPCANGTYQPQFSQEECLSCPEGSYTPRPGSGSCFVCENNTWGPQCRRKCNCVNGICNTMDGSCFCHSGWQGENCDVDIPGCSEGQCFPGVTCADVPAPGTGFTCGPCPPGYVGNGITCRRP